MLPPKGPKIPNTSAPEKPKRSKQGEQPAKHAHGSIFPPLPDDISLHILASLPLSSYSRLRLVCRAWRHATSPTGPVIAARNRLNLLEPWIVFVSETFNDFQFLLADPAHRGCLNLSRPLPEPLDTAPSAMIFYADPTATGKDIFMPAPSYNFLKTWRVFNPRTMYCFDVQRMDWTTPISLLTQSPYEQCYSHCACATLDGYLYFVCGTLNGITKKASRLDIALRTWEALPDLTFKRLDAAAVVLQGRLFIIGGFCLTYSRLQVVDSAEMWDPNSRQWILVRELWPGNIFGNQSHNQSHRPCVAVLRNTLYALRAESRGMLQELMYYDDSTKVWNSMGKISFPELVESKCAFRVLTQYPCRMVGVADELIVFCCTEPLVNSKAEEALRHMVALYVKPTLSEPLAWRIWPLPHLADHRAEPLIVHV